MTTGRIPYSPRDRGRRKWNDRRAIAAQERAKLVLDLRKGGASFQQIADQIDGITHRGTAAKIYYKALAEITLDSATEAKTLDLERIDLALLAIAVPVRNGDVAAVREWRRLIELRARIIGYMAPVRQIIDVVPQQVIVHGLEMLEAEEAELAAIEKAQRVLDVPALPPGIAPPAQHNGNGHGPYPTP